MKLVTYLAGTAFCFLICLAPAGAQTTIDTPGAYIQSGPSGTTVIAPGVTLNAPTVSAPQAYVPSVSPTAQYLPTSSYANAQLPGMNFSNQTLAGADFSNSTLTGASFSGSNLQQANFSNASLQGVDFTGANLRGASFTNADMEGCNLTNADLSQADLTNTSLDRAIAVNTRFAGAILTNVDMGKIIHNAAAPPPVVTPTPRPSYIDAGTISSALKIDPAHPSPHKIDLTINFDTGSDKLTSEGGRQVAQIAAALKDASLQTSRIMIEGHTDNVGKDDYNKDLSYRRAMRVTRTLVETYGIQAAQLSAEGFGKSRPIATNNNDLGRAMNRRVTLINLGE